MAPAVVYLHIGSPKTGTTYLQDSLWDNREVLAEAGVLLPGRSRVGVSRSVGDLLRWRPDHGDLPRTWQRLCAEVNAWSGHAAVLSHEHVHKVGEAQWSAIVESFPGARIEIVLTARDLARSVPAQWQSSVRQRYSWTLGEYAEAVAADGARAERDGPARHFWRRQDAPEILRRFIDRVTLERVRLVTVPPSGGDPDELWRRFCRACDLLDVATTPGSVSHESLGAASAEIMRRLNASAPIADLSVSAYKKSVNHTVSRRLLAPRRGDEPGLTMPDQYAAWAQREAEELIGGIEQTGVTVIGDLDDLRPRPSSKTFVSPEGLPAEQLLEAAMAGLAGLAALHAEQRSELDKALRAQQPRTGDTTETAVASAAASGAAETSEAGDDAEPSGVRRALRRLQRGS